MLRAAAIAALACLPAAAFAAPLATLPYGLSFSDEFQAGGTVPVDGLTYSLWVAPAGNPSPAIGDGFLMLRFTFGLADVGRSFVASVWNMGPDFTAAAARLTNGTLGDYMSEFVEEQVPGNPGAGGGAGAGSAESATIGPLDLGGESLGSVIFTVDSMTIVSPGLDPNHDGKWTDVAFNGHLVFDSDVPPEPVPAPAGLAGFALGLGVLSWKRRRS